LVYGASVARGGRRVRVLESKPQFEPAPRTLIVTDQFRNQMGASAREVSSTKFGGLKLFTDGPLGAGRADEAGHSLIERSRLIPALAREAKQAGAQPTFDTRFLGIGPNARGLRLEVENRRPARGIARGQCRWRRRCSERVARASGWPPIGNRALVQAIVRLPKIALQTRRACGSCRTTLPTFTG